MRLVDSILDEIDEAFGVTLDREWTRLATGDDAAVFGCGDLVVKVGPTWRSDAELEWSSEVAIAAAGLVPEAIAPLTRPNGATVVRIDDRPVTLWQFVVGDRAEVPAVEAAELLARVHRATVMQPWRPRPASRRPMTKPAELVDRDLDTWLSLFDRDHTVTTALHGDFTPANVLSVDGHIVALLDWDDAFVGPPERELAWAAFAWSSDLTGAAAFVDAYRGAGGPARRLGDHDLRQLARERIRLDAARGLAGPDRLRAFHALRVPSGP